jgi:hypothetical protein
MNLKYVLFLTLCMNTLIYSQIKGVIVDSESKLPISFVTILRFQNNAFLEGLYSDANGNFEIPKLEDDQKLELSHVEYEKKIIYYGEQLDTIFLVNSTTVLKEVIITNTKKINTIGFFKCKRKTRLSSSKGMEICQFIENPYNKQVSIKSLLFRVKRYNNYKTAIRVRIYKKSNYDYQPGEEIISENIIYFIKGKEKKLLEINLLGLVLPPEGAFFGIEWLGNVNEKTGEFEDNNELSDTFIEINDEINKYITFKRNRLIDSDWKNTANFKKSIENQIKFKNIPNASFGLTIYED